MKSSDMGAVYEILHINAELINGSFAGAAGLRNSSDVSKTFSDFNIKGVTHTRNIGGVDFTGFTEDTFSADILQSGGELKQDLSAHPYGSMPDATPNDFAQIDRHIAPWGTIDANGIIEYYTP